MEIDERARYRLFTKLEEKLGPEEAAIMMGHLPPAGWGDVARRQDLDALAVTMKRDVEAVADGTKRDIEMLRLDLTAQLDRALRRQTWAVMTSQAVIFIGLASLILGRA